jgi:hypothetical protein
LEGEEEEEEEEVMMEGGLQAVQAAGYDGASRRLQQCKLVTASIRRSLKTHVLQ